MMTKQESNSCYWKGTVSGYYWYWNPNIRGKITTKHKMSNTVDKYANIV